MASVTADLCFAWGAPNRAPLCPPKCLCPSCCCKYCKNIFCAVQRGRGSVNRILNLCLSVSIFLPLARVGAGMPGAASWWDWHWKRRKTQGSKFSSMCLLKRNVRNPLSCLPLGAWALWGGRGCRVQAFPHLLREMEHCLSPFWDAGPCFQREMLWCHFPWILPLSAAQGCGFAALCQAEL